MTTDRQGRFDGLLGERTECELLADADAVAWYRERFEALNEPQQVHYIARALQEGLSIAFLMHHDDCMGGIGWVERKVGARERRDAD